MAGTTEPLAEKPKTFDTVGNLPAMPKLNEGASKLTGASKAEFEKALGVYQPFLTAQEGMVKGLGRAESDILQSEQEQKRIQATGTSAAAQKQVADIERDNGIWMRLCKKSRYQSLFQQKKPLMTLLFCFPLSTSWDF